MGFLQEFKEFAMKGNALDMAVGIIIGAAFNKIVQSLVNDVIMPPLGWMINGVDFKDLKWILQEGVAEVKDAAGQVTTAQASEIAALRASTASARPRRRFGQAKASASARNGSAAVMWRGPVDQPPSQ